MDYEPPALAALIDDDLKIPDPEKYMINFVNNKQHPQICEVYLSAFPLFCSFPLSITSQLSFSTGCEEVFCISPSPSNEYPETTRSRQQGASHLLPQGQGEIGRLAIEFHHWYAAPTLILYSHSLSMSAFIFDFCFRRFFNFSNSNS